MTCSADHARLLKLIAQMLALQAEIQTAIALADSQLAGSPMTEWKAIRAEVKFVTGGRTTS